MINIGKLMLESLTLNVLTLNIWGIWFSRDQNLRLRALCATFETRKEDILCLQEVWQASDRAFVVEQARKQGYIFSAYFAARGVGSGLLILSIFPIIETQFKQFDVRGRADRIYYGDYVAGKGIGLARVKTPAGIVDVYNTHTIAQYQSDEKDEFRAHRRTQHYEISQFIAAHTTANPVILAGDFNMRPDQPNYQLITTLANLTDCYALLHPDDAGITLASDNPYHAHNLDLRLDYIFVRAGTSQSISPKMAEITLKYVPYTGRGIAYSDHYGVTVTLEIAPKAREAQTEVVDENAIAHVYEDFRQTLVAELQHISRRHYDAQARYQLSWRVLIGVVVLGRVVGKKPGMLMFIGALLHLLIRRRLAQVDVPQEIDGLKSFLSSLEKQKARSE